MKLFHYWRSTSSWRVRMALAFKGIHFDVQSIDLLSDEAESPEHLKRNPSGFVPVLQPDTAKEVYLSESTAIIEWLEEMFPSPRLLSEDPWTRAKSRELAQIINSGTHPIQNPTVTQYVTADPALQKAWNQKWIRRGLSAYEAHAKQTSGSFSVGDQFGYADLFLIPQCYNATRFEVDLAEFPRVNSILENTKSLDWYLKTHPERYTPNDKTAGKQV